MIQRTLIGVVLLAVATMSAAASSLTVWCVGESTKVKPGDPPQVKNLTWDGNAGVVTIGSARNEYVAFQVAVRSSEAEIAGVTVTASDLTGPGGAVIPASNIDLFVEHYLNVRITSRANPRNIFKGMSAGEHPTQMVPFSAGKYGAPFTIGAGRNQPVWVDIYVPEKAVPGLYSGVFRVEVGGKTVSEIKVALTVWSFILPHETHFLTYLYTGPENLRWAHRLPNDMNDPAWAPIEDRYFQMAHQHRLNFHPIAGSGLRETFQRYYPYYDGSGFRERVGRGVGQNVACITPAGKSESDFKNLARKIVQECEDRKFKTPVISYIADEPHSEADFSESRQRCKWVREAVGSKLLTFIATPQWWRYEPGDVNIYSEPAIEDIARIVERGDTVWSVNGGYSAGPYVDSPGYGGRSIPLMNWKMNLGGWQFWDCCYWVDKQCLRNRGYSRDKVDAHPEQWLTDLWNDPMTFDETRKPGYPERDAIRINGDGVLFYPGHDIGIEGPIASYAMKSLRRGAQDYEYLWLLRLRGCERQAQAILDTVCPAAGRWSEDPEAWDRARLEWAKLLDK